MNLLHSLVAAATFAVVGSTLAAQDQATTLSTLAQQAQVVVRATVAAASDPSPLWHRVEFTTVTLLKGSVGTTFPLLEPAGACCGRSLFALQPGDDCLLFLQRTGLQLHPLGGARGVLPCHAALLAEVQSLLTATDAASHSARLVQQLGHADPRIADDAAHALVALPNLVLSAPQRSQLLQALQTELGRGSTRAPSLAEAAARVADAELLDQLVPLYLHASTPTTANLLRRSLVRTPNQALVHHLLQHLDGSQVAGERAAELLQALPDGGNLATLQAMLAQGPAPAVQLRLVEGLLAQGVPLQAMPPHVPAPVLQLAAQRQQRPRPFRAIQPHRR